MIQRKADRWGAVDTGLVGRALSLDDIEADVRQIWSCVDMSNAHDLNGFHPTACPICSSLFLKGLHSLTAEQAANAFVPVDRDEGVHASLKRNIEGLWKGPSCEVVHCDNCQFAFPIPYVGGDKEFYELAYGVPSYPHHRWEYDRAIESLKSLALSASPRLLELGAGVGQFIKMLLTVPAFQADRIVATDFSLYSVAELRKLGVDARRSSVFELAASRENHSLFDAVCAFQSIEHMADIKGVMTALIDIVKPKGLIILSVPHGPAIDFNERHLRCLDMPPNHVGRWYRQTFEMLAEKTGLELVTHEIEPRRWFQLLQDAMVFHVHGVSASKPGSLARRAQGIRNRHVRRMFSAAIGSVMLVPLLPTLLRMDSGYAQLAVFRTMPQRTEQ